MGCLSSFFLFDIFVEVYTCTYTFQHKKVNALYLNYLFKKHDISCVCEIFLNNVIIKTVCEIYLKNSYCEYNNRL